VRARSLGRQIQHVVVAGGGASERQTDFSTEGGGRLDCRAPPASARRAAHHFRRRPGTKHDRLCWDTCGVALRRRASITCSRRDSRPGKTKTVRQTSICCRRPRALGDVRRRAGLTTCASDHQTVAPPFRAARHTVRRTNSIR
jgi:hypothetical protein